MIHGLVELIPAPGLLLARLANYWGHKACSAGRPYLAAIQSGEQEINLAFLDESNSEINHVFGFDSYKLPSVWFNQCADAFVYCFYENKRTMVNPPYDQAQTIQEIVAFRRNSEMKQKTDIPASDKLSIKEQQILALLTMEFSQRKRETVSKEQVLDFALAEITAKMTVLPGQEVPETFNSLSNLDVLMPEEDQSRILGCCYKERMTDEIVREGVRGAYAIACANLARAMYNEEMKQRLSGIFFDMQTSWHILMEKKYDV